MTLVGEDERVIAIKAKRCCIGDLQSSEETTRPHAGSRTRERASEAVPSPILLILHQLRRHPAQAGAVTVKLDTRKQRKAGKATMEHQAHGARFACSQAEP